MLQNNSQVLVTGGAGFIGSHLVDWLVTVDARVTVVDNFRTGTLENLSDSQKHIRLIDSDLVKALMEGEIDVAEYDYIFHLAANAYVPPSVEYPLEDFRLNLHSSVMLLEAMRNCPTPPKLIYASSGAVYGNPVHLPICESDPTVPISPYGVSKLAAERYVAVYSQIYGIEAVILRFFSVYGPRQRKQVVYDLMTRISVNPELLTVYGDGTQTRDFVFVQDVVQALGIAATSAPAKGEVYNVASGKSWSISELVNSLLEICNYDLRIQFTGSVRDGDAENWTVDISRLLALGYKPAFSFSTGLQVTKKWFNDHLAAGEESSCRSTVYKDDRY